MNEVRVEIRSDGLVSWKNSTEGATLAGTGNTDIHRRMIGAGNKEIIKH